VIASKRDRRDDIGHSGAAGDERRPLVNHPIPDLARRIIPVIAGEEYCTPHAGPQLIYDSFLEDSVSSCGHDRL
jgi:hypothetical protein